MQKLAEQIIVDIIKEEMALADDNVFITNQNKVIPNDENLYVSVGMVDAQPFSNTRSEVADANGEDVSIIQQTQVKENIQIDIMSAGNLALTRRWEILMALKSIYSVQKQEEYGFKIFDLPTTFVNGNPAEGGSQINRFIIVISCFVWYRKDIDLISSGVDYYDDFDTRVDDANTIGEDDGLIEFNITGA